MHFISFVKRYCKISYICTKKINNNPKIYSYGKVII